MLKTFMQPGTTSKTDSNRTSHPTHTHPTKTAEPTRAGTSPAATDAAAGEEGSKLIVGPNIKLKGAEITDCEILVVEGRVEAAMNSRVIRIAEGGVFSGKAEIDVAEVRGHFEGELTARKRLVIYSTGRVNGTIRYGAMMMEEGGVISGNVAVHSAGPSLAKVPEASVQAPAPEPAQEQAAEMEQIHSLSTLARNTVGRRQG